MLGAPLENPCSSKYSALCLRGCVDIIPTCSKLHQGHVEVGIECKRCGEPETITHVLRDCPWSKQVWEVANMKILICATATTFKEWVGWAVDSLPKERLCKLLMVLWQIWNFQNNFVVNNEDNPTALVQQRSLVQQRALDFLSSIAKHGP